MMHVSQNPLLALSDTMYRSLLIVYPAAYRQEYGSHMAQLFRDCCRDAYNAHGSTGIFLTWLFAFGDLVVTACMQRLSAERSLWPMNSRGYLQRSGIALMLSGILWVVYTLLTKFYPAELPHPYYSVTNPQLQQLYSLLALATVVFLFVGLASFIPRVVARTSLTGRILFILTTIASLLALVLFVGAFIDNSEVWAVGVIGVLLMFFGLTSFGIHNLRANTLHRWNALFLIIGLLGFAWGFANPDSGPFYDVQMGWVRFGFAILFGLGLLTLGYTLWLDRDRQVAQPPLASA